MELELIFCKKCYEKGEYSVATYEIDEKSNELEYYCIIHKEDNTRNFITLKLNDDLKRKLIFCQKHINYRYFAWCNTCKKNICFICYSKEKHDYSIYCNYYPSIHEFNKFLNFLRQFVYLRMDYDYLLNKHNEKPDLLIELNNYINIYELYYKLVKEENIYNFQILLNLKNNIKNYEKTLEKFKSVLFKEITQIYSKKKFNYKYKEDIITINLEKNDETENIEIISLELEDLPKKGKNNFKKEKSKNPFAIYYKSDYNFVFYDPNRNVINEISHENLIHEICDVFQYKKSILLLRNKLLFLFLYISNNMQEIQFSHVFCLNSFINSNKLDKFILLNDIYIGLFSGNYLYYVKFKNDKLFQKDCCDIESIKCSKELINQKILDIFPICNENKNIKKFSKLIGISLIIKYKEDKSIYFNNKSSSIDHNNKIYKEEIINNLINILKKFLGIELKIHYYCILKNNFKEEEINQVINKINETFNDKIKELKQSINNVFNGKENKNLDSNIKEITENLNNKLQEYFINNLKDIDDNYLNIFLNYIQKKFKELNINKILTPELAIGIVIFNDSPSIEKAFEISVLKSEIEIYFSNNLHKKQFKLNCYKDYLIFYFYEYAYIISLKYNEIVNIYNLNYIKETNLYGHINYKINKNEYNRIKQSFLLNFINSDIKIDNIKEYDLFTYRNNIKTTFINFKDNLNIIKEKGNSLICIDYKETRIIQLFKLNLQINDNYIFINLDDKTISIKSINPFIYKLIFPNCVYNNVS